MLSVVFFAALAPRCLPEGRGADEHSQRAPPGTAARALMLTSSRRSFGGARRLSITYLFHGLLKYLFKSGCNDLHCLLSVLRADEIVLSKPIIETQLIVQCSDLGRQAFRVIVKDKLVPSDQLSQLLPDLHL